MLRTPCNGVLFSWWHWREQIIYLDGNQGIKLDHATVMVMRRSKIINGWERGKSKIFNGNEKIGIDLSGNETILSNLKVHALTSRFGDLWFCKRSCSAGVCRILLLMAADWTLRWCATVHAHLRASASANLC
jgi:hypothetical protein